MDFSQEDIQLLHNVYDDIMNLDEDQVIDAWAAWAGRVSGASSHPL
jgi:hypothetical protein